VSRDGVRLHYIVAGSGPLLLFLHGIPDFCHGWRHQMDALSAHYRVAAMDLRGFNLSDKPPGLHAYRIAELIADVLAVMRDLNAERATLIGHDWGGILGWWIATLHPAAVEGLAALAVPHPLCYLAARNAGEIKYPQLFLDQIVEAPRDAPFDPNRLSAWVHDEAGRMQLAAALRRSDPESIRNYYRANLPASRLTIADIAPVHAPVLVLYGAEDGYIPARYYRLSAKYMAGPGKIVAIAGAGHFIHTEAAERVTTELAGWLGRRADRPNPTRTNIIPDA
jgi:pimeloyl-ACP methyl ester carboxylesterase